MSDFAVMFRTGGTVLFRWHRSLSMTRPEAVAAFHSVRRMGYQGTYVVDEDEPIPTDYMGENLVCTRLTPQELIAP